MKAEEKANVLFLKYFDVVNGWNANEDAKQCALIAVDEIKEVVSKSIPYKSEDSYIEYWQQVKQEINKL